MYFVFGSNLDGWHGKGAALTARKKFGAQYGVGEGITGMTYALPTVGHNLTRMPIKEVEDHIAIFLQFAANNLDKEFKVTRVGCGLGGHKDQDIAPMFRTAPSNCMFDTEWRRFLGDQHRYWGTF